MKPDAHTPCPVCPQAVRNLYQAAAVVGKYLETLETLPHALEQPVAVLQIAVEELAPFIEAHRANQDHALSPELETARAPKLAA